MGIYTNRHRPCGHWHKRTPIGTPEEEVSIPYIYGTLGYGAIWGVKFENETLEFIGYRTGQTSSSIYRSGLTEVGGYLYSISDDYGDAKLQKISLDPATSYNDVTPPDGSGVFDMTTSTPFNSNDITHNRFMYNSMAYDSGKGSLYSAHYMGYIMELSGAGARIARCPIGTVADGTDGNKWMWKSGTGSPADAVFWPVSGLYYSYRWEQIPDNISDRPSWTNGGTSTSRSSTSAMELGNTYLYISHADSPYSVIYAYDMETYSVIAGIVAYQAGGKLHYDAGGNNLYYAGGMFNQTDIAIYDGATLATIATGTLGANSGRCGTGGDITVQGDNLIIATSAYTTYSQIAKCSKSSLAVIDRIEHRTSDIGFNNSHVVNLQSPYVVTAQNNRFTVYNTQTMEMVDTITVPSYLGAVGVTGTHTDVTVVFR